MLVPNDKIPCVVYAIKYSPPKKLDEGFFLSGTKRGTELMVGPLKIRAIKFGNTSFLALLKTLNLYFSIF